MSNIAVCVLIVDLKNLHFLSVSLKQDHKDFNMPGGSVELGETLEEAGIREVMEETGIKIYNLKKIHSGNDGKFIVETFYTTKFQGEIYTTENHVVKWLPLYELTKSKKWNEYNSIVYEKFLNICNI